MTKEIPLCPEHRSPWFLSWGAPPPPPQTNPIVPFKFQLSHMSAEKPCQMIWVPGFSLTLPGEAGRAQPETYFFFSLRSFSAWVPSLAGTRGSCRLSSESVSRTRQTERQIYTSARSSVAAHLAVAKLGAPMGAPVWDHPRVYDGTP